MKITYNWLKQYLPVELAPEEVAVLLTDCGLEVEGTSVFQTVKGGLSGLVIGQVKTCLRHPNADKLSLTTVDIGSGQDLQIVCGAPNVAVGQRVVVAPVGTTVHPTSGESFEIKKSKIRGELSEGMICAEDEIGLGRSHEGILVLPETAVVGQTAKSYFNLEDDIVFEIGLTPNRVDAASHLGVARDLAAILNLKARNQHAFRITMPEVSSCEIDRPGKSISVTIHDAKGCPRYTGITLEDVTVADSPDWLKQKLQAIGIGPINNIVDITNYVLHECGQPLHAFDADKIVGGSVHVRRAQSAEKFVTLDSVERELSANDLMICNAERSMCIAGVFGGLDSGITASTKSVFLESAYFDPASIRKTGKFHGLKTDASFRYERGADPSITRYALLRAASLIREIAGGKITSQIIDHYPDVIEPVQVELDYNYLDRFSGHFIDRESVLIIVQSLGMQVVRSSDKGCTVSIPTGKVDVTRSVDVVEEVLRIYGYNNIPVPAKLNVSLPAVVGFDEEALQEKIASFLAANGFNELFTNSLTRAAYAEESGNAPDDAVRLLNPLSQDLGILRQELLHTGLEAIQYNRNRKQSDVRFFEFGKSYHRLQDGYHEKKHLVLFLSGAEKEASWNSKDIAVDHFLLKGFVQRVLENCGIDAGKFNVSDANHSSFSSGVTLKSGDRVVVTFGTLKRSMLKRFDITADTVFADFSWDTLLKLARKKPVQVVDIPKFPQVRRDLSMLISQEVQFGRIEELAYKTERKLLKDVRLFDVYDGDKIEAGKKSYAVAFLLQDEQQTLTDQQIDKVMDKLMLTFEKEVAAVIRKA